MAQDNETSGESIKTETSSKRGKASTDSVKKVAAKKPTAKKAVTARKTVRKPAVKPEKPHAAFTSTEDKAQESAKSSKFAEDNELFEEIFGPLEESFSDFVHKSTVNLKEWNKLMHATNDVILEKVSEKSKELYDYAAKKPVSALLVSVGVVAALYKVFKRR